MYNIDDSPSLQLRYLSLPPLYNIHLILPHFNTFPFLPHFNTLTIPPLYNTYRYRTTFARILDANRKFIEASARYYELSTTTIAKVRLINLLVRLLVWVYISRTVCSVCYIL